jgi:hypothetical protein
MAQPMTPPPAITTSGDTRRMVAKKKAEGRIQKAVVLAVAGFSQASAGFL